MVEARDTAQEAGPKPSQRTGTQDDKVVSEELSQIARKRREVKGKGERERYTQLKAEFQRRARREKKAFLNDTAKKKRKTA